ncbi:hypothetical protein EVJ58_g11065, partial [Rhodofomes roseus]
MRSYTILAVAASVVAPSLVAAAPVQQGSDALSISKVFHVGSDIANAYSSYKQNKQNNGKRDDDFFEFLAREAASTESPSKTGEEPQAPQAGVHAAAPEHEGRGARCRALAAPTPASTPICARASKRTGSASTQASAHTAPASTLASART